jgi:hypothetical protein
MNIVEMQIGEMVMKYKSVHALRRDADEIQEWFTEEWQKLDRLDGLYKAIFDGDDEVLAKAANSDLELAKSDVSRIKLKYGRAASATLTKTDRMASIMREYTSRSQENDEQERRSRRFNAAWDSAPLVDWQKPTLH